jgi:hypothetical protein
MKRNYKFFVLCAVLLTLANLSFSVYARSLSLKPSLVCENLQKAGLVTKCQEGAPWAFTVTRYTAQWEFEPTGAEVFKCYTVTDGLTHVPCLFRGTVAQFASDADLEAGLAQIRQQNYRKHSVADLQANVTRADTTLEQYDFEVLRAEHLLVIFPITENLGDMQHTLLQMNGSFEGL